MECLAPRSDNRCSLQLNSLDEIPIVRRTTTEDVLESLKRPIAVVGNGPIRPLYGERIDEHATVIRFNSFRLTGYEAHVGRRMTHWCFGGRPDLSLRRPGVHRLLETFRLRRFRGIVPNPSVGHSTTIFTTNPFSIGLMDDWMQYMQIEPDCVGDATLLHPLHSVISFPSTGFVALYLLLLFQTRVSAFGFTGLVDGHYWNSRDHHSPRHLRNAALELALIRGDRRIKLFEQLTRRSSRVPDAPPHLRLPGSLRTYGIQFEAVITAFAPPSADHRNLPLTCTSRMAK